VNAGLRALDALPFEYLLLRQSADPWAPEDTFLIVLSMFTILQETDGAYETTLATMRDVLPPEMFDLLAPRGTEWDAPIDGSLVRSAPIPGPEVYDLRTRRRGKTIIELPEREREEVQHDTRPPGELGSNNWAVSGAHMADGHAWIANDMHLVVRVPNTWYRVVLEWPDSRGRRDSQDQPSRVLPDPPDHHRLVGITLPGVPALVVGSNSFVAWGFTNTYADWSDIVLLDVDPDEGNRYRTPEGWRTFERHEEIIRVAGASDERAVVTWTIWGPVMEPDHRGRPRAYRWVAHDADRLARSLAPLENARTVHDAFDAVNGLGAPGQNFVVADRDGRIGWTVYGAIPRRIGFDGRLPSSWSDGTRGWYGWLDPTEYPRLVNPPSGRIWTANARVIGGEMLARLGDGNFEVGSRATIIRRRLMAGYRMTREDLLSIQLDTSADFMTRWRELLLRTLASASSAGGSDRARVREIVDSGWSGRASSGSAAYRLTRAFREAVTERVIRFVLAECYEADPSFDYYNVRRREGPVWKLVTDRPQHLLDPQFESWDDLLLSAVDEVIADGNGDLHTRLWSDYNETVYRHPLSAAVPFAGRWLDMPARALDGDLYTPNMHWGSAAPSERLIVSPGREEDGLMHMPTGQSGHPLSPFYSASHDAWAQGTPTPLMPGPVRHTMTLVPSPP
jgi:penicillin amidase